MGKDADDYRRDYTDPKLRERLKERIKASDKGGAAGKWSARKSQLLTQEYEREGGGYRRPDRRSGEQRDLRKWTEEEWQTASGDARARDSGSEEPGGTDRYLPRHAWEQLSPRERRQAQRTKRRDDGQGKGRSPNPPAAESARRSVELDRLPAAEAAKKARGMSSKQARSAAEHERGHKARKTVLRVLDRRAEG
ncbi:hypothetical protein A9R04_14960 [Nocardiopsis dassonvillei]|uniref:hypothetical protein n=1 Tax=Nocardiopsis dassonvillei TaxID=2014 RepID=UPI0008FCCBE7|nr:hypothetical protein [Nocardiopsis dassonvillei]APC35904.1 hypothetical protein A9R04_14960 [Nocardiopsis dassonvillei]